MAELIGGRAPWQKRKAVELVTLRSLDWFNHSQSLEPTGCITSAEAEAFLCSQSMRIVTAAAWPEPEDLHGSRRCSGRGKRVAQRGLIMARFWTTLRPDMIDPPADSDGAPSERPESALFETVYAELKLRARRMRLGHGDSTLDTTALVHESFLKIMDALPGVRDREHLYRLASLAMRQLLIDNMRERSAEKRGGGLQRVDLEAVEVPIADSGLAWASIYEAIQRLDKLDSRMADVFLLRTFGDLGFEDIAALLDCSKSSAHRDFDAARAYLLSATQA